MDADVQAWNQTAIGSMDAHRLNATDEISCYRQCWENDGSHVLGSAKAWYLLIAFPRVQHWRVRLMKMCYEVSSSIAWKRPKNAAALFFHHDNAPPHRAAHVHQFFDDNNFEVVPYAPYSPHLAPSDFWLFKTEGLSPWSQILKSFRSCNSDFPVVTTNP